MGPVTVAKLEMDRQVWHVYRRGEGGPLALSIRAWGGPSIDIEMPPYLLAAVGHMLSKASDG